MEVSMKDETEQHLTWAVQRFLSGEKPELICASLGRSRAWLYKWVQRHCEGGIEWSQSLSKCPLSYPTRTPSEVEEIVKMNYSGQCEWLTSAEMSAICQFK
jgi:putative transposase